MTQKTIDLIIRDAEAAQSVGEIKKAVRELQSEMVRVGESDESFARLAKSAANLKEQMNSANETIAAFNPDPIEAVGNFAGKAAAGVSLVTGAMGLFGEQSEETEKALLKVQSAMAFAQGIEGVKGLTKSFQNLFSVIAANPLVAILTAITAIGAAAIVMYQNYKEANSEANKLKAIAEETKKIGEQQIVVMDNELRVMNAQGASAFDIHKKEQEILDVKIRIAEAALAHARALVKEQEETTTLWEDTQALLKLTAPNFVADAIDKKLSADKKARVQEAKDEEIKAHNELEALKADRVISELNYQKIVTDTAVKQKDANDKILADKEERFAKELEAMAAEGDAIAAEWERQNAEQEARETAAFERRKQLYLEDQKRKADADMQKYLSGKRAADLEKKIGEMNAKFREDSIKSALSTASVLFADNAKAQKAISAAMTLVDTYFAAQKAYTSQLIPGDPSSPIRGAIAAGLAVAAGLAKVKAILSVDIKNPSSSGGGGASGGGGGSLQTSSQPNISSASQPSTLINEHGQVVNQQQSQQPVWVSVSEIRQTGAVVEAQETRSSF